MGHTHYILRNVPLWFSLLFLIIFSTHSLTEEKEEQEIYLVLAEGDPVAFHRKNGETLNYNSEATIAHAKRLVDFHEQILESTLETGSYNKLYSFKHILNGFAVYASSSQAKKLESAPGVKLVEKDRGAKLTTTYTPEFLGLPEGMWAPHGGGRQAGEGIVIGFVDTGINPLHPSFAYDVTNPFASNLSRFTGACETGPLFPICSCNGKIVSARFFSAGAQAAAVLNASVDFLSPFDSVGHGSHVASTAAGNAGVPVVVDGFFYGRASGMAPHARIAVYKAVYPTIGTLVDVVAAIDQAVRDGVDIITLSVGPDVPPQVVPTMLSVFDLSMLYARRAGVLVVQAAGNGGPAPSTVVSYGPWAMGVAAGNTDRTFPGSLLLGNGLKVGGIGLSDPTFGTGLLQHKLVLAKDAVKSNGTFPRTAQYVEECQYAEAFEPNLVLGSVVICIFSDGFLNQRSTLASIINTARTLRFMGFVLMANPKYGDFSAEPVPFSVSGISVPRVLDSEIVSMYYEQKTRRDGTGVVTNFGARAAIGDGRVANFCRTSPVVSRFSSRGPDIIDIDRNLVDVLKPDVLAPGHQIWAAWSPISASDLLLTGQSFALLSGTSMATPHVAGIAALLKQQNPSWSPSMIASALSTTATKYDSAGERIMAEWYGFETLYESTHFDLGAGHVSPVRATDPGLVLSAGFQDYITFLCSLPNITSDLIKSVAGVPCTASLSHPANLNTPSVTVSSLRGSLTLKRRFTNVADKKETYVCSVVPPNGTTVTLSPILFTVDPQGTQAVDVDFNVTEVTNAFGFGEIVLTGSLNHIVRIPLSVKPISMV